MSFPGFDPVSAANMAYLSMMTSSTSLSTSMQRLSTGLRINSAGDDPAGLAESQVLLSQINSMNQAMRSVQDQTSLTQVASGALTQESSLLQSMLTLATSSATGTLTQTQLAANQAQMNQYAASLTQITNSTTYNGQSLLTGAFQNQQFQVGPNAGDTFSLSINPMDAASLGVAGDAGVVNATQNTANVTSLTGVGNGFVSGSSGEQYKITATSLTGGVAGTIYGAATNTATNTGTVAATVNTANQASAAGNQGSEWMTLSGTAGGAGGGNYLVQVTSVNSDGSVGGVKISSNGGSTWSAPVSGPTFSLTGTGGLNATFATGAAPAQVGDQFSFTVNNNQTGAAAQAAVQSGTNVGRSTITFSGTYTGTANVQYGVRAVSEDGSNTVTGIQVSQDGGKTWSTTIGQTTPGTPTFAIGNGLSVNWATGTFNPSQIATATNNDAYYFNVVAANQTTQVLQLSDSTLSGGSPKYANAAAIIGAGALINAGQTQATLGTGTQSVTANFGAQGTSGGITAGSTTFTVTTPQAAAVASGVVLSPATAPAGPNIMTTSAAQSAITQINTALNTVSLQQAQLGAVQNRLADALTYLQTASTTTTNADNTIMDANIAQETINMTTQKIIQQGAQAMLAQANQMQAYILRLYGINA